MKSGTKRNIVINDIYQLEKCIKQTATGSFFYGFHLRMRKEILIIISNEPMEYSFSGMDELSYFPYVIDHGKKGEKYYTVLNYVRGVFLKDFIKQKREFTEKELISLGLQICDILSEFEKRKILAIEIWNPDNVMLTSDLRISFLDSSSLTQKNSEKDVSKDNLTAAIAFMHHLCQDKSAFSTVINKEFKEIHKLHDDLLSILKLNPEYKKLQWKQRIQYGILVFMFIGSAVLLQRNVHLYQVDTLLNKGNTAFNDQNYAQAIADYQDVLDLEPDNITARRRIAESYWNEGNVEKAEEYFQKNAIDFEDQTGEAYLLQIQEDKAFNAYAIGDYAKSLEYYRTLEDANPNIKYEEMLFNIYLRQNDFDNIEKVIQNLKSQEVNGSLSSLINETSQMIERSEKAGEKLCELADLIEQNDWLALSEKLKTTEYMKFCEQYGGDTVCGYDGGIYVKLYKSGAIYLGEIDYNKRSGHGKLVLLSKEYHNLIIFNGEWQNDMPNGMGVQEAVIVPYLKENRQIWISMEGNYTNGYSDGDLFVQVFELTDTEKRIFRSVTYNSNMGYLEPMQEYEGEDIIGIWNTGQIQYSPHYNHIESVAGLGLSDCYFYFDEELD